MKLALLFPLLLLSILVSPSSAATHTIMFGPGYYSPATLQVAVGDTVIWQADDSSSFAAHPLESYMFPASAPPIYVNTGTTYQYVVTIHGTYKYRCQFHWTEGMLGEFSTTGDPDTTSTETRHVIMFGPGYYSPDKVHATIGDTIVWIADDSSSFSAHPLQSYLIPPGAQTINVNSGTMFEYVAVEPGHYKYRSGSDSTVDGQITVSGPWTETKHVVVFGSNYYIPANFTVDVGDTIIWMAESGITFVEYPMQSYAIPAGAAPINATTGTTYTYAVAHSGTYKYWSQAFAHQGLMGEFTAIGDTTSATRHVILFGHTFYNPSTLTVDVGDTIVWQGVDTASFAAHPLESYSFPAGATPIYVNSGTTYSYVVMIPGIYKYRCQIHWPEGMMGQFSTEDDTVSGDRHTIMFGPGYYSPANLIVDVGDVIVWQADDSSSFAGHPLESYDFPAGAAPIYVNSGTTYEYTVMVPGTYKYRCQLHWPDGMLGQFSTEDEPDTTLGATHVIRFGPGYYSPSTLRVEVGDTVMWQADDSSSFAGHPLESYDFPSGATPIFVNTGTTYRYVVMVPGTYRYRCQLHWMDGMLGEFTTEDVDTTISERKHIITFDNYFYSPVFFSDVLLGDTIEWRGNFSEHPLISLTVPLGAAAFANNAGTVFQYVVTVPGRYNYACATHGLTHNMVGSFQTQQLGVNNRWEDVILMQAYPNPTDALVRIPFELRSGGKELTITLHDVTGREVHRLAKQFASGKHEVELDLGALSTGSYTYRITGNEVTVTGQFMLAR